MTVAITAKRAAARISSRSSFATSACRRFFSTSSRKVTAMMPDATRVLPAPASTPAAITTNAATSVVPSTSRRLAA